MTSSNQQSFLTEHQPLRLGLMAAAGQFPVEFARAARRQGHYVHCVGIAGMVSHELESVCDGFATTSLARLGKIIRLFRRARVDNIVMAGKIEKKALFHPFRLIRLLPDWRTLHMWYRYAAENKKDDTIMLAIIREFERDDLKFKSALEFCPEILVKHGFLTRRKPSSQQWRDINFGWDMAKEIGRLDIGQTVVVSETAVIAVEAIEGTDSAIRRAGKLCPRGGFVVVKVAKPKQDMRFDVPTIGLQTIQTMHEAGGRVLAIESDKTIILDREEVIKLAEKLRITIVALNAEELKLRLAA
jgi:DUF1009 family protein